MKFQAVVRKTIIHNETAKVTQRTTVHLRREDCIDGKSHFNVSHRVRVSRMQFLVTRTAISTQRDINHRSF